MKSHLNGILAGAVFALAGLLGSGFPAKAGVPQASYASTGARTSVPYGWIDFCNRYTPECDGPSLPPVDIDLTPKNFAEIERINRQVNSAIEPVTDMDHWGVVDRWDFPIDGKGDCEDYALLKRKLLTEAGYPRQALLMTVVKDRQGEGHAVLTAKTDRGEFVLDNLNDKVKPWASTGYSFVKRQSQENPNSWITITPSRSDPVVTSGE